MQVECGIQYFLIYIFLGLPLRGSHIYVVHDENGADHKIDKLVVACFQTFEMLEIP